MRKVLLDTGPLVAFLNRRDRYHKWASAQWERCAPPLLTCEAVLAEACFLLRNTDGGSRSVIELVKRGVVAVAFDLEAEAGPIARLMTRYADVPMSLADACLVRMTELQEDSLVLTADRDFLVYRRHGRQTVHARMPAE